MLLNAYETITENNAANSQLLFLARVVIILVNTLSTFFFCPFVHSSMEVLCLLPSSRHRLGRLLCSCDTVINSSNSSAFDHRRRYPCQPFRNMPCFAAIATSPCVSTLSCIDESVSCSTVTPGVMTALNS